VNSRVFYPGVSDRTKAKPVVVNDKATSASYDFEAQSLPVVPIPIVLDEIAESSRYSWHVLLEGEQGVEEDSRAGRSNLHLLYGVRGRAYRAELNGFPNDPLKDDYCRSEQKPFVALNGMAPVHLLAKCK